MALYTLPETGHFLTFGHSVPSGCVNLCYLESPLLTPDSSMVIMNAWRDIPGNENNALAGTREITVTGVEVGESDRWSLNISPGSFYTTIVATVISGDLVAVGGGFSLNPARYGDWLTAEVFTTDPVSVTLFYTTNVLQAEGERVATSDEYSDPFVEIVEVPSFFTENVLQVVHVPLNPAVTPTVSFSIDGTTYQTIDCTIIDVQEGLILPEQTPPEDSLLLVSYTGTQSEWNFLGNSDHAVAPTTRVLDLNPMPGHFSVSPVLSSGEVYAYTVYPTDESLVHSVAEDEIEASSLEVGGMIRSKDLASYSGVYIYLDALTALCVSDATDTTLDNPYTDIISWSPGVLNTDWLAGHGERVLLARVYPKSPISISQVAVYDTRVRGGGIKEEYTEIDAPESELYFDVVNLDGIPSMENGAVIIQVSQEIYDRFGDAKVRQEVENSLAAGIAYVLEVQSV